MLFLQGVNLALRFVLELCALAAVSYWGFKVGGSLTMKWLLGLGTPLLMAVLWGVFGSPKAIIKLSAISHFLFELLIFGLPAIALFFSGKQQLSLIYAVTVVVNRILMYVWNQ